MILVFFFGTKEGFKASSSPNPNVVPEIYDELEEGRFIPDRSAEQQ